MKITFKGTMAEFQTLFYGFDDEEFQPSGRSRTPAFNVVPAATEEDEDEDEAEDEGGLATSTSSNRVIPLPKNEKPTALTATLTDEERSLGWAKFCWVCKEWVTNFGEVEEVEVEEKQALRNAEGQFIDREGNPLPPFNRRGVVYETVKVMQTQPKQPQPDRLELLRELGTGRHTKAVLVMAYEIGSLQQLVGKALLEETREPQLGLGSVEAYQNYIEQIAANMVQISHMVFPDLAGTYDYSTKWKRSK